MKLHTFILLAILSTVVLFTGCSTIAFNYTDTDTVMTSSSVTNDSIEKPLEDSDTIQTPDIDSTQDTVAIQIEPSLANVEDAPSDSPSYTEPIDYNAIDILINKQNPLPSDYEPTDLVIPDIKFFFDGEHEKKHMRTEAAQALEQLFEMAKEKNIHLFAVSGYRSYKRQEAIFNRNVKKHGFEKANTFSAQPGQSEHQTGLAMDVSCSEVDYRLTQSFGKTQEGQWIKDNAHSFGFIIRYPKGKETITGYMYEPWHLRYVGKELATQIYESELTMEEFFNDYSNSKSSS